MTTADAVRARIDPVYRAPLAAVEAAFAPLHAEWDDATAAERRARLTAAMADLPVPSVPPTVTVTRHLVPGRGEGQGQGDQPAVRVIVVRPTADPAAADPATGPGPGPAVVHVHGGGMWLGSAEQDLPEMVALALEVDAVVVGVDYRLAPEHPYPAALRDVVAVLDWLAAGVGEAPSADPGRIALHGGSAGGGLAIAAALWCRDHDGPMIRHVTASAPMLDDRSGSTGTGSDISTSTSTSTGITDGETDSAREVSGTHPAIWDREANAEAWSWYLGGARADQYAAPTRAERLDDLPPTTIDVGAVDLFRDEDIAFAQRLASAGVPTGLLVVPGVFHGADGLAPDAPPSVQMREWRRGALRSALHPGAVS